MTTDTTPAAIEPPEVARFEMEQVGAIGTMDDGEEVIIMGVLLSGDTPAIKWAGKHIFSSVVLMRATDHAALAAERDAALRERDEAENRETLTAAKAVEYLGRAEKAEAEAAALRKEVARLREALSDPIAVHANMLRGAIALPSVENIIHAYGAEALRAALTSKGAIE